MIRTWGSRGFCSVAGSLGAAAAERLRFAIAQKGLDDDEDGDEEEEEEEEEERTGGGESRDESRQVRGSRGKRPG